MLRRISTHPIASCVSAFNKIGATVDHLPGNHESVALAKGEPPVQKIHFEHFFFPPGGQQQEFQQRYNFNQSQLFAELELLIKTNRLPKAEHLFNAAVSNNVPLRAKHCGLMIKGFAEKGDIFKAEQLVQLLKHRKMEVCSRTIIPLLKAYSLRNQLEKSHNLLQYLLGSKVEITTGAMNAVLLGYCKQRTMEDALLFLKEMGQLAKPDAITVATIVEGFANRGKLPQAERFIQEMKEKRVQLNSGVFNSLIKGYLSQNNIERVQEIINKQMPENFLQPDDCTILQYVDKLVELNKITDAEQLLQIWAPRTRSQVVFNTVIRGFMRLKEFESARRVLTLMRSYNIELSDDTYAIIIHGYISHNFLEEAEQIFNSLPLEKRKSGHYNVILKGYISTHGLDQVERFFESMKVKDACSYNTLMHHCAVAKNVKRVEELWNEMISRNICPDSSTYDIVTNAYLSNGCTEQIERFLQTIPNNSDIDEQSLLSCYANILKYYLHNGNRPRAVQLFNELLCSNLPIDAKIFNIMQGPCMKDMRIEEFAAQMHTMIKRDVKPNPATFTILQNYLIRTGRYEKAEQLFQQLIEQNEPISVSNIVCLVKGLIQQEKISSALEALETCKSRFQVIPNVSLFNVALNGIFQKPKSEHFVGRVLIIMRQQEVKGNDITVSILMRGYRQFGCSREIIFQKISPLMKEWRVEVQKLRNDLQFWIKFAEKNARCQ